ncbi:MAG TPA: VanW family protein [Rhizomicrobium sp.]|nr:VanW family protein [Rhizomicrobium sp.]
MAEPATGERLRIIPEDATAAMPSRAKDALYRFKVFIFRTRRLALDLAGGVQRLPLSKTFLPNVVSMSRTPLWSDTRPAERLMQLGKVQNLRIAARLLDGTDIAAGRMFSFWKQLGHPNRFRGFSAGRMLQQGCMVPSVGGGLCQLSNALYDAALKAECEIVERHAHSRVVPGSVAAAGRDATVAWNYVDLRFRAKARLQLRVRVLRDELVVEFHGDRDAPSRAGHRLADIPTAAARTCGTCEEVSCFRHERESAAAAARTAYLVDEAWPEFVAFVARERKPQDAIGVPIDGRRWGLGRYDWDTDGFRDVAAATDLALWRSLAARRLAKQGPERQIFQLRAAEALAGRLAKRLTADVTDVIVAQSLLPFLWRDGHLGGRRFRVLMTRLPIRALQSRLDEAAQRHPERTTLADFRAPAEIAAWEDEALAAADGVISPHAELIALYPARAMPLAWRVPSPTASPSARAPRIAFPGPTVARKGAYELRDAARRLAIEIVPLGSELEGGDFWSGVRLGRPDATHWLSGIGAVVQPAVIEESPRRLLAALANGVPVIATRACGLPPQNGLTIVPSGDADALAAAIRSAL